MLISSLVGNTVVLFVTPTFRYNCYCPACLLLNLYNIPFKLVNGNFWKCYNCIFLYIRSFLSWLKETFHLNIYNCLHWSFGWLDWHYTFYVSYLFMESQNFFTYTMDEPLNDRGFLAGLCTYKALNESTTKEITIPLQLPRCIFLGVYQVCKNISQGKILIGELR